MESEATEKNDVLCVLCGGKVEGECKGVMLSICCIACCMDDRFRGYVLVTKTNAMSQYHLRQQDLQQLHCSMRRNPKHRYFSPMRLYVRAELEHLGCLRAAEISKKQAERDEKERAAIMKKKQTLHSRLGSEVIHMDAVMGHFMLGDYLKKRSQTFTKQSVVIARFKIRDRVAEILHQCPRAHPGAAFEFCMEYPDRGPTEFSELKSKVQAAWHIAGMRILHCLGPDDKQRLKGTPLDDILQEFNSRNPRAIIKNILERHTTAAIADAIMKHPVCLQRIFAGGFEEHVAQKLLEFWKDKDDPDKRRRQLETALEMKGVHYPDHWYKVKDYINGMLDIDLDEMVAWCIYHNQLKNEGIHDCSQRASEGHMEMQRCLHERKLGYEASIQKAVHHALSVRVKDDEEFMDTDSDSYDDY